MSNWQKAKVYCRKCRQWKSDVGHRNCPKGSGSITWIDIEEFKMGCGKCNSTWALGTNVFYCGCGNVQETEYQDLAVVIEAGDQIIASDGDVIYVLRRSGTVVVGRRSYSDFSY